MRKFFILLIAVCNTALFQQCSNTALLEKENADLRAKIDSLENQHATLVRQKSILDQRIVAMQEEKQTLEKSRGQLDSMKWAGSSLRLEKVAVATQVDNHQPKEPLRFEVPKKKTEDSPVSTSASSAGDGFVASYQEALAAYNSRNYVRAIGLFDQLLAGAAQNDLTDNCIYSIGECLFAQKKYNNAIEYFSRVIDMEQTDKRDAALIMRGNAYLKLKMTKFAQSDFERIVKEYPSSEYYSKAKQKLDSMD